MDEVREFLEAQGWTILEIRGNLVRLFIDPIAIVRAAARLRRSLEDVGVFLYKANTAPDKPCAWVEFDVSTLRSVLNLVISDEYMPRTRAKRERDKNAETVTSSTNTDST